MNHSGLDAPWNQARSEKSGARPAWRGLTEYLRPHLGACLLAAVGVASVGVLQLVPPLLVRGLIDVALPAAAESRSPVPLLPYVVGMVAIPLLAAFLEMGQHLLCLRIGQEVARALRGRLLRALHALALADFTRRRGGELVSRVWDDVTAIETGVARSVVELATQTILVVGTLAVLAWVSWPMAAFGGIGLAAYLLPSRRLGSQRRLLARQARDLQSQLLARLHESLDVGGWLLVRLFHRADLQVRRFDDDQRQLHLLRLRQAVAGRSLTLVVALLGALGPALVYGYGGWLVVQGRLSLGYLIAVVAWLANLHRPASRLASLWIDVQSALVAAERIVEVLDAPADQSEPLHPVDPPACQGELSFDQVSFTHVDAAAPILRDLTLRVGAGETVALVGPSGAGKSTLLGLAARLYLADRGVVRLDGHDIRTLSRAWLASHVGMIPQDAFLFHASLRDNLLFACPDASDDDLREACRVARLDDLLAASPAGLDVVVGERGLHLSGGERQRLAIARLWLRQPRILLLDEATSALDAISERLVQDALTPLLEGRTVILVAHRLATVRRAQRVIVLDGGVIVEQGRHDDLIRANGLYARLAREQALDTTNEVISRSAEGTTP